MQDWKKEKNKVQKRWRRMQVWKKKKQSSKALEENASLEKKKNKVQKRWRMQVWKKKKKSSKALEENASLEKKKTKVKSLGKCYRCNLKKSGDGKDIIKKDKKKKI